MALRVFSDQTGWEQARKDTRFTAARLDARKRHAALSKPLRGLLAQWATTDQERRDADDAVVDANALVSALDEDLDEAVTTLVSRLLYEANQNEQDPTFKAFFAEAPSEVIRLGLESEIARTKEFAIVAAERTVSKEIKAILKTIANLHSDGTTALKARESAYATVARISLRIQTWKENANAVRRGADNALDAWAIANGKERNYSDRYFPAGARAPKKAPKPVVP